MIPGKTYKLDDFAALAWRRKWLIVCSFAVFSAGTLMWSQSLPNLYRSETVILVVPQRVPDTYVRTTVTSRIEDRLQSISPEILSRTRLEQIIDDLNLYAELRKTLTMEEVVQLMRENIKVDTIEGDAFKVSYISGDPQNAMEVTKRLASMFIVGNLRDRENLADETNQFLESQLNDARARLVDQEKKLEQYRRAHAGELPSQVDSNLQIIQNSQMQLRGLGEAISRDRDRLTILEGLVADALAAASVQVSSPAPPANAADAPFAGAGTATERLEAARRSLASLQLRLTPEHPDMIRMKRAIRDLERAVDNETRQRQQSDFELRGGGTAAEVVARTRVRHMQAEVAALRQRIADQEAQQQRLTVVIATYERHVAAAPTRESELAELMRDYDTLRSVYASLLARREDAKIAANLERRQVGEQFKILDPPRLPEKPFSPDRFKLNLLGAFLGLAFGAGLVALIEYRDTSLHTQDDVLMALQLPVLALIPLMGIEVEQREKRRRICILCGVTTSVLLLGGAAMRAAWKAGMFR
jgi:polysaccharide chain length determinant protein (PEP-CTERM system associated)